MTRSIWHATSAMPPQRQLLGNAGFDIVIVGGGIVGMMTAYELRACGKRVALLEARSLLNDVTGNTTGKVTSQHGLIYNHLVSTFGQEAAQHYADANEWAIQRIAQVAEIEEIECDYVTDAAHVYTTDEQVPDGLLAELEACVKLGLPASLITQDLIFSPVHALRFDNQARFHPLKFLSGLVGTLERAGIEIYERTRVLNVEEEDDICKLETEHGQVTANQVVIATNYPIHDSGLFVAKLAPYRSYAIAVEVDGFIPDGMFITDSEPMHSFRRQSLDGHDILIVGGEHHKVGQADDTEDCFECVESWVKRSFNVEQVLFRWSTQDNWTPDRIPYVGKSPNRENIYIATGFGGWGMTTGVVAGRLLSELLLGKESIWAELYAPGRLSWGAVPKLIKENVNVASHLVGDKLKGAHYRQIDDVPLGVGAIVQLEDKRAAVFREAGGIVHVVESACSHMGCQLNFNTAELSWDCPCHGSRFDVDGTVLHGPAVNPLHQLMVDSAPAGQEQTTGAVAPLEQ